MNYNNPPIYCQLCLMEGKKVRAVAIHDGMYLCAEHAMARMSI